MILHRAMLHATLHDAPQQQEPETRPQGYKVTAPLKNANPKHTETEMVLVSYCSALSASQ